MRDWRMTVMLCSSTSCQQPISKPTLKEAIDNLEGQVARPQLDRLWYCSRPNLGCVTDQMVNQDTAVQCSLLAAVSLLLTACDGQGCAVV